MRGVLVVRFSLTCIALVGGCGGTADTREQSGGAPGRADGGGTGDGIGGSGIAGDSERGTGGAACDEGTERCPCYGNGTCNAGLVCASDLCVDLGADGEAGADGVGIAGGRAAATGIAGARIQGGEGGIAGATAATGAAGGVAGMIGGGDTDGSAGAGIGGDTGSGGRAHGGDAGGAGTGGAKAPCSDATPCGGDVVGSWRVASSCLELKGDMDVGLLSLGCPAVPVTGSLQTTGTFVANSDGTYADNTVTSGAATFPLAPECLTVSSVPLGCNRVGSLFMAAGWSTAACTDAEGECSCSLTVEQKGGLGSVLPYTEPTGSYTADGTTFTAENAVYSYCVVSDTLSLAPQMSGLRGTVVLQKDGTGSTGAGGAGGTG